MAGVADALAAAVDHAEPEVQQESRAATTRYRNPQTGDALLDFLTLDAVRGGSFAAHVPAAIIGTNDIEQFRDYPTDNVERWLHTPARQIDRPVMGWIR
ncbi:hypothetical protein [Nocardia salmonicida]|uniref:hypothetical protein n=1 Tax=Nocardia salmonicida TaxID=53431 RepID=UPI0007A3DA5A|nr:hypothetical protein [Nocardia salmonicida]